MATYGGTLIAPVTRVRFFRNPRREQNNAYAGVNGLEMLDMGSSGGSIVVEAVLYGVSPADLNSQETVWDGFINAASFNTLVDNLANSFYCKLRTYEPTSEVGRAADGGYLRSATLTFAFYT